ncbi:MULTISPECIES: M81 family metallopeptidase [unclassified Streptomyces]|uniref:M81 family metallopeptidase n=1 Tax=unclassified Streptomyces TaxID=2593676 RepID=UPI0013717EB1|nr:MULTISPECIES: M81 family metallopeptidase [unclassified Streptomyces]NDZ99702.1 M81 family metallopeptidase [Streptomyces sp. SID10116]MYY87620.1 microcystin degradation protein MlrC [Streptomyces sp. SID335]MYZ12960.1 microcystin degradation protein MlrC [Streptomyces sp. SID337]NDZ85046.1 M81 family metallopeptidase [Streptomyces sp. SID10115]NEB45603.1 M81 family metallopeptidase [Streptomyces sp. SID339]
MTTPAHPRRLRIGIGGIGIESSTFCPHRSTVDDFRRTRGQDLLDRYTWTQADSDLADTVEWVPLLHATSLPGGPVEAESYLILKDELVTRIREAGPLDGLVHDIHGAMSVIGLTDAEADLTEAVRAALDSVGTPDGTGRPMISAAMDLHGNVSRRFAEPVDLLTAHRLAPHEDAWETRERAARNLVRCLREGVRPHRAWVQVPVLLPGEKTSTRLEPAKSLYASLAEIEKLPGILDAALWVGYAWADEPRCRAAVVVTGEDADLAVSEAEKLARRYWDARRDFVFVGPTGSAEECIAEAVASDARPFLISDSGDNPTAGGAGDLAYMLVRLLDDDAIRSGRVTAVHPGITDPVAVARCFEAGIGAEVTLSVGGKVDAHHGGPCDLTGTVVALQRAADRKDRAEGGAYDRGVDMAAVRHGGLTVILVERRKPFHTLADFMGPAEGGLGIDPRTYDLVVVKIGYLEPELHDMAADWLLALTPGGVDQDLPRLGHHRVERPLYPFDEDAYDDEEPDLTPTRLAPLAPLSPCEGGSAARTGLRG